MNEVEEFLEMQQKPNTRANYETALNKYFSILQTDPNTYFKENRDYEKDVLTFVKKIHGLAPVSQRNYMSVTRNFLMENDIELSTKFWRKVRKFMKRGRALTLDRAPTHSELKQLLSYADMKTRLMILMSISSGMRVSELMSLVPEDVDLEHEPGMITLRSTYTKTGDPRITFISDEAKELLKLWLIPREYTDDKGIKRFESERDRYLRNSVEKMKGIHGDKPKDDPRIFPVCESLFRHTLLGLLKKTGLTKKSPETGRFEIHVHSFRKFFLSQCKLEIPVTIAEAFAGHRQYLDEAYSRYSREQLAEYYTKAMHRLMVYTQSPDLTELHEDSKKKDEQIQKLQEEMKIMQLTMQGMKNELDIEKIKNGKKK
jgi:integrase